MTVTVALALTSKNRTAVRQPVTLELKERPSRTSLESVVRFPNKVVILIFPIRKGLSR
jgi:hypothetical protein